ncbi:MAG: LysR substrate-binding domain-containing protein [Alphaproteobacteria bacterium]|nr:LysR substrate-binding domain-containing protein [Alphaproteobacteria bacterium]
MHINHIDLRHLRYFLAVAEELNFSRAAAKMHITQPPLSQKIQEMEAHLETRLFARTKRRVELTQAGIDLFPRAKALLRDMEEGLRSAHAIGHGYQGMLRIGTVFSAPLVPAFGSTIRHFRAAHPSVRLVFREMLHAQQFKALANNEIDIAFIWHIAAPADKKFLTRVISDDPLRFYLSAHHRLASKRTLSVTDLADETLFLPTLQTKMLFLQNLQSLAHDKGLVLNISQESSHFPVIANLVAAGAGIGVFSDYIARLPTASIIGKDMQGLAKKNMQMSLAVVYRRDNDSKVLAHFLDNLGKKKGG